MDRLRLRACALPAALVAIFAAVLVPPAAAQPHHVHLSLVEQPVYYSPGDNLGITLAIHNRGDERLHHLRLVVSAYDRVSSRSALHEFFDKHAGFATSSFPKDLGPVTVAPHGSTRVTIDEPLDSLATLEQATSDGVYPLTIALFSGDRSRPLDMLYLPAVYYLTAPSPPLNLVLLAPLNAIPGRGPTGRFIPGTSGRFPLQKSLTRGGWLRGMLGAIHEVHRKVRSQAEAVARLQERRLRARRAPHKKHVKVPAGPAFRGPPLRQLHLAIAPTAELVDEIADMSNGFSESKDGKVARFGRGSTVATNAATVIRMLRSEVERSTTQTVLTPYSYAALPPLVTYFPFEEAGLGVQLAEARRSLHRDLHIDPSNRWVAPPLGDLDAATLDQLPYAFSGEVGRTFFSDDSLREVPHPAHAGCPATFGSLTCPIKVASQTSTFKGYATDPDLTDELAATVSGQDPRLAVQDFLADTAMIRQEAPGSADRVVQVTLPAFWSPSPSLSAALFDGIAEAPWLQTVTPAEGLRSGHEPVRRNVVRGSTTDPSFDTYFPTIGSAGRAIDSFASMNPPEEVLTRLRRNILVAEGAAWARTPALEQRARSIALSSEAEATRAMEAITVVSGREITLTSRRGRIRLDLSNGSDYPLTVRLLLYSPKLSFSGDRIEVNRKISIRGGGQRALDFQVSTKASGIFQLDASVETPDGRVIDHRTLTVRSTNFNEIALAVTGGAFVFLVLFYVTRPLRRRRRTKRAEKENAVTAPEEGPASV